MVKGFGLIDEIKWEGDSTLTFHLIYVGLGEENIHDPELYLGFDVEGVSPSISQATLDSALATALKNQLINEHGFSFGLFDTVRIMGAALSGLI